MPVAPAVHAAQDWLAGLTETPEGILAAVSGGSDSLAMLHILKTALAGSGIRLTAATVDHGLRPDAAREARFVGEVCDRLGIPHEILAVRWKPGERPSQARARGHRYRLLAAHAKRSGAALVVTGHTENDQAETFFLRLRAGSSWWGLAGMQDESVYPVWPDGAGLQLGRPVLTLRRSALRAVLTSLGQTWADDPSNEDSAYERVRIRRLLAEDSAGFASALSRQTRCLAMRADLAGRILDWTKRNLVWLPGGAAQFQRSSLEDMTDDGQLRLFQHLLACVGGRGGLPRRDRVTTRLAALTEARDCMFTMSGCQVACRGDQVTLSAECPTSCRFPLPERESCWRGRVRIQVSGAMPGDWHIAPWAERPVPGHLKALRKLPFAVRKALPVIVNARDEIVCVPHVERCEDVEVTDLAPARLNSWLRTKTHLISAEYVAGESFSPVSCPMLEYDVIKEEKV